MKESVSVRRRVKSSCCLTRWLVVLAGVFLVVSPASAGEQPDKVDARRAKMLAGKTAWQADEKLKKKWAAITGRFIFQRVCLECHQEGPSAFTRDEWKEGLQGFPGEMHPELPRFYSDLTAMFDYGRQVPKDAGRLKSLTRFLLTEAPKKHDPDKEFEEVDLFPSVGKAAPDFKIKDIKGSTFQLKSLKGKKNLVLVFSRAHW